MFLTSVFTLQIERKNKTDHTQHILNLVLRPKIQGVNVERVQNLKLSTEKSVNIQEDNVCPNVYLFICV